MRSLLLLPLTLIFASACSGVFGQEPASPPVPESKSNVLQLVEQLGAEKWSERKSAAEQLMTGGDEVTAALRKGLSHADAEVRRQSRRLLVDRVESDLQIGITALKKGENGGRVESLPGWARYRKEIGDDADAREQFAAMLTDEAALLFACQAGGRIASKAANARIRQVIAGLYNRISSERRTPSRGTIAAIIFAAAHPDAEDESGLLTGQWMSNLVRQSSFVSTLTRKPPSAAAQKLVGLWMKSDPNGQEVYRLQVAISYKVKEEGLKLAMRVLADPNAAATNVVTLAMEAVARLGEKKYSQLLVPLLEDKRGCGARIVGKNRIQIEVRDVALVWLIWSSGQQTATYGYPSRAKTYLDRLKTSPTSITSTSYFYFESADARKKAFDKWDEWVKKSPLPKLPADAITEPVDGKRDPAGLVQNPAGIVKPGAIQETKPDDEPRGVPVADRIRMQMLRRAQELLEENPGHVEAISLIGRLLTEDREWVFRTEGETPVYRTIRSEAEDIISRLTPRQLQLYEQQFGTLAQVDFQNAVDSGTSEAVAKIVEKYFFTRVGADAAYWIASMQVDRGQFFPAALWLSRLKRSHPSAGRFEPMLSVLLAFCWHESGVTERAEEALTSLRENGNGSIELFGQTRTLPRRQETGRWLAEVFANHGSQGPSAAELISAVVPIVQRPAQRTRIETVQDDVVKQSLRLVDSMHEQFGVAAIPQSQPVVVGDVVIFRTLTDLQCVSFSDSTTQWQSPLLSGLDTLLASATSPGKTKASVTLARALRERIWDRSAASSLVTDGRRVFAVEDVSPESGGHLPALEILPDGTPTLREGSGKTHNRLTAWDIHTGKVLWECGGPPTRKTKKDRSNDGGSENDDKKTETFSRPLAGVRFIGTPQPLGDQLCVLGQIQEQIDLVLIDSASGDVVWTSTLHMPDETSPAAAMPWMPFAKTGGMAINTTASVPVLSDDSLFVYVGYNRYVAFDLASRRVLWAYEEKRNKQPGPPNMRNIGAIQKFASKQMTAPDRWVKATPNVVGDRVLITPPATDLLVCLDRDTGRVVWEVPREDGLFVPGVVDGVALIVGRSSVRGVRIVDGKSAWQEQSVALPDGIQPAGQGILIPASGPGPNPNRAELHLPQAHGMVAVLDIATGQWSTGEWKVNGPAGNLTSGLAAIVSQDATGVTIFDRIDKRRSEAIANLPADSTDVDELTAASELALQANEIEKAIAFSTRAMKAGGGQNAESSLALALTTSLRRMPKDADAASTVVEETLESARLLSSGKDKATVLRSVAALQKKHGQHVAALENWLKITELLSGETKELKSRSFVWRVREDRWIQAEIAELFDAASEADRKAMTRRMLAFQEQKAPGIFIRYFGFHESANVSRLAQAEAEVTAKKLLAAEQLLIPVSRAGSIKERVEATRRLSVLLKEAGQHESARGHVEYLAAFLANDTSAEGKEALAIAESPLGTTTMPLSLDDAWPIGPVSVDEFKVSTAVRSKFVTGYALLPESRADDYQSGTVELDSRLTTLFARDALGRQKWKITVKDAVTSTIRYLRYSVRYNQSRCSRQGQLTVAWIGDQVCAVDGLAKTGKPLWSQTCSVTNPLDPNSQQYRPQFRPQMVTHLDAQKLPLAVTPNYACFQRGRKLIAVDPLDGSILWWRDDLPSGCDLFGDSDYVFARKPGEATAIVLRGFDGKKLGTREVPEIADRVMSRGRKCVSAKTTGDKFDVVSKDLWTQEILWQRTLKKGSHLHVVSPQEVALLQAGGQFEVVDADNGNILASATLKTPETISDIVVQRRLDRLVVAVNEAVKVKNPIRVIQQPTPGHRGINGELYILAADGKEISHSRFADQSLKINQPGQLPLLILFRRYQERKPVGNNGGFTYGRPKTKIALLDVRSGRIVHQFDREFGSDTDYQLNVNPSAHQIELKTRTVGLRIDFSEP